MSSLESLPIEIQLDILEELYEDNLFAHGDHAYGHLSRPLDHYWSEDEDESDEEILTETNAGGGAGVNGEEVAPDDIETEGGTRALDHPDRARWENMPTDSDLDIAWRISGVNPNGTIDPDVNVQQASTESHGNEQLLSRVAFTGDTEDTMEDPDDVGSSEENGDGGRSLVSSTVDTEWTRDSPLKAIGLTSKHFRKLTKPLLFRTISLTLYRRADILHKVILWHVAANRNYIRNVRIDLEPEMTFSNVKRRDAFKAWYDIYLSTLLDRRFLPNLHSLQVFYARSYPMPRTIAAIMERVEHGDLTRFGVYSKYTVKNLHNTIRFDVFTNNIAIKLLHAVADHPKAAKHLRHLEVHTDALLPVTYDRIRSNLTSLRTLSFRRCLWMDPPPVVLYGTLFSLHPDLPPIRIVYSQVIFPRISVPAEQIKWAPNDNLTTLMFYDCQNVHSGMILWLLERYPSVREVSIATCGHDSDLRIPGPAAPRNTGDSRSSEVRNVSALSTSDNDLSQDTALLSGSDPDPNHPWTPPNQQVFFPSSPYGSRQPRPPLDILRVEHACLWELFALSHIPTKELYITNAAERVVVQVFQWGLNVPNGQSHPDAESTINRNEAPLEDKNEDVGDTKGTQNIVEESGVDMDSDLPPLFPHLEILHVVPPRRGIRKTDQSSESRSVIEWVNDVDGTILEEACKRRGIQVKRDAVKWRECQCHQEDYL